jgi:hypothetical protein
LSAYGRDRDIVTTEDIDAAIHELQWLEFTSSTNRLLALKMLHAAPQMLRTTPQMLHTTPQMLHTAPHMLHTAPHMLHAAPHMLHAAPLNSDPSHVVGRILVASAGKTLMERELTTGRLVVGRTPDNDLQIDSKFISRHHCHIVTHADSSLIEDLNSTNGIYVQSKRVRRHNLNDGDVVQVGQHEIMYIDERIPRLHSAVEHASTDVIEKP